MNSPNQAPNIEPLKGVVIVSGGSRGLGAAIVQRLLATGYQVATFSRRDSELTRRLQDDPNAYWESVDCTDYQALRNFVVAAERRFGNITGLVNNAGIGTAGILTTMPLADIDTLINVNLKAHIHMTKLVAGRMLKSREGSIVNISSVNAIRGHSGVAVYSATKAALDALTRSLAKELGSKGIRVNSVSPGYFASDMVGDLDDAAIARIQKRTPLGRLATEEDIAELVLFLIASGKFITGQNIAIDGGLTC